MRKRYAAGGKVALAGYAHSPIYRRSPVPVGALVQRTSLDAIADAGLRPEDIDGVCNVSLLPSVGAHSLIDGVDIVTANWLARQLKLPCHWIAGYTGYGTLLGSLSLAANAIASGAANHVLLFRALSNPPGGYHDNALERAAGENQWTAPYGFWGPPESVALSYMEYLQRYGARREAMATLLVQLRSNVQQIPRAYWHGKPLAAEDYFNARMIADPVCILDCDIPVEGAAAFILTSAERARDMPNRPVYVAGFAQAVSPTSHLLNTGLDDIMDTGERLATALWRSSGVKARDVDVPQLYDGFSPLVYYWLECLGFCPRGEAHRFIQNGAIDVDGKFPLLSGGGALGNGRMHGVPQLLECYLQLSQRANERQLRKATVGIASHSFPHLGAATVFTSEPH